ncbi:MAG TPA: dTDP-4-dehydrorhamnose reductase [Pyrinomonadaceae bacterium]|nr:dTDP-4-dehydrorhamnose reductase [Pyrinomonadaceae bacterium]
MRVLITGAGGMLGKVCVEICREAGDEVFSFSRAELDISDPGQTYEKAAETKPEVIINCAAMTDVDGAESKRDLAYSVNCRGVWNLATAARLTNSLLITVSTDFVFDGTKDGFYTQRDTPNPLGIYAKSKRDGELAAIAECANSIVVRSGWIFGLGGKNFLSKIPEMILHGREFTAINDSFGTPTFAVDLAKRIRELAILDLPGIYHVVNSGPGATFEEFARLAAKFLNCSEDLIAGISAEELKRPAPRPKNSRLACLLSERLGLAELPDWKDALERFCAQVRSNQQAAHY